MLVTAVRRQEEEKYQKTSRGGWLVDNVGDGGGGGSHQQSRQGREKPNIVQQLLRPASTGRMRQSEGLQSMFVQSKSENDGHCLD